MLGYHLDLALRSLRRSKGLTFLMVLAIALGVGASTTTLTVFHVLSADPIPARSARLFRVQLDAESRSADVRPGNEPNEQLTRFDAEALLRDRRARRQAVMSRGAGALQADGAAPFHTEQLRYTSADFFLMFGVAFRYGQPWQSADDAARARVVVLSSRLNEQLFGGTDSTGRTLRVSGFDLRIVGVVAPTFAPAPRFYDLSAGAYPDPAIELAFVPYATARDLKLRRSGSMDCWGEAKGDATDLGAPCAWLQVWVELDDAAAATAYRRYLDDYSEQQRIAGRFDRPPNTRLRPLRDWLDFSKVVPADVRLQLWLALGFLVVCLVNTVGLLLAKCLRRAPEIGIRRALGASRRDIFRQFVVEAGVVGVAGGLVGLLLALAGLWVVRRSPATHARLAELDATMLGAALALALVASLVAGLLPAWRACRIAPALQLKSP